MILNEHSLFKRRLHGTNLAVVPEPCMGRIGVELAGRAVSLLEPKVNSRVNIICG